MKTSVIILILLSNTCRAQVYENLVFEGAGIRGIAYAGVLEGMEQAGLLKPISNVAGTSAGALIALTISLGYSSSEIRKIIEDTDFSEFNDGKFLFFGGVHRVSKNYGWYRGNKFDRWISKLIVAKTTNGEITFKELHQKGYKDLYITATCLNKQKLFVFSFKSYPDMKVKDAIRISMSIPLYFEAVLIDHNGVVVKETSNRRDLDLVVDGGIIGNFPISIFDSIGTDSKHNKIRIPNSRTLGVRIDSDSQIESDQVTRELTQQDISDLKSYMEAFYTLILENLNRNQLTEVDWMRTISVSSQDIGPRIKKLSSDQKEKLVSSGRQSMVRFLATRGGR
jgi:NTE family protein